MSTSTRRFALLVDGSGYLVPGDWRVAIVSESDLEAISDAPFEHMDVGWDMTLQEVLSNEFGADIECDYPPPGWVRA